MTPKTPPQGLRSKTLSGLRWSFTSTGVSTTIQLAHMVIMARLLAPADFGLVALAMAFLRFGIYIGQLGVDHALMQRLTLNEREIRTAFTVSVSLGVLLAGVFYLIAPFAKAIVEAPEVVPVIQMLALSIVIQGLGITALSLLKRELRFRGLAAIEVGSSVIGYVFVGITLAVLGFGVWSLVFAALGQALLQTMAAYAMSRHAIRPSLSWAEIKTLYGYGGKFAVTQFVWAGGQALTTAFVGRVAGIEILGLFDRTRLLVQLPFEKVEGTINKVLFPAMSRVQTDTQILAKIFLLQKALVMAVVLPMLIGMAVNADILIAVLLGPQWLDAAEMVPFLATAAGILFLGHFSRLTADVKALLNQRIAIESARSLLLAASLLVGAQYGLNGLLFAIIAAEFVTYLAYMRLMQAHLMFSWARVIQVLTPGIFATAFVGIGLTISKTGLKESSFSSITVLIVQMVLGGILLAALWISPIFSTLRMEMRSLSPYANKDASKPPSRPSGPCGN